MTKLEFAKSVEIKKVLEDMVGIKAKGNMICCPFHKDDTPSMSLRGSHFHCFGCGAKGSNIDLVLRTKYNNDSSKLMEAVNDICLQYGFEFENISAAENAENRIKDPEAYKAKKKFSADLRKVAEIFNNRLEKEENNLFSKRGIDENIQKEYLLGFIPKGISYDATRNISSCVEAGLCDEDGSAHLQDRFIISIRDKFGNIIGFLGRAKDGQNPKYLVTRSSKYFQLSNTLFNYDKAKIFDEIIIVEGTFDALSLVACGIQNVVATFSCSLSEEQKQLLQQKKIVIAFDNDEAGQTAAKKYVAEMSNARLFNWAKADKKDFNEILCTDGKKELLEVLKRGIQEIVKPLIVEMLENHQNYSKKELRNEFKKFLKNK